jgi:hypothetical protein
LQFNGDVIECAPLFVTELPVIALEPPKVIAPDTPPWALGGRALRHDVWKFRKVAHDMQRYMLMARGIIS